MCFILCIFSFINIILLVVKGPVVADVLSLFDDEDGLGGGAGLWGAGPKLGGGGAAGHQGWQENLQIQNIMQIKCRKSENILRLVKVELLEKV